MFVDLDKPTIKKLSVKLKQPETFLSNALSYFLSRPKIGYWTVRVTIVSFFHKIILTIPKRKMKPKIKSVTRVFLGVWYGNFEGYLIEFCMTVLHTGAYLVQIS